MRVQVGFLVQVSRRFSQGFAAALVGVLLSGCATSLMDGIWGDDSSASSAAATSASAVAPNTVAAQENVEVAKLYNEALADLNGNSLKSALKQFSEVEQGCAVIVVNQIGGGQRTHGPKQVVINELFLPR